MAKGDWLKQYWQEKKEGKTTLSIAEWFKQHKASGKEEVKESNK